MQLLFWAIWAIGFVAVLLIWRYKFVLNNRADSDEIMGAFTVALFWPVFLTIAAAVLFFIGVFKVIEYIISFVFGIDIDY